MRYTYRGDRQTRESLKGMQCDPVLDKRGKCIRGANGNMQVIDGKGVKHAVLARQLRTNKEPK